MSTQDNQIQQAITLATTGRKEEARRLLQQVILSNPKNELAWIWLADTFETMSERKQVLQWCLQYNPDFHLAQKGIIALGGAQSSDTDVVSPNAASSNLEIGRRWDVREFSWCEAIEIYYCDDCGDPMVICGACGAYNCPTCQQAGTRTRCNICNTPLVKPKESVWWARLGFSIVSFRKRNASD